MNPITFSTLACPNWQIETVIAKTSEFGYDGIEWRGGPQGHVQPDMPGAKKALLQQRCSDAGLMSLAVTAYTSFVSDSAGERQANVDELRRYAELAAELGANYVRAFLGELPEGTDLDSSMYERISDCLNIASVYANSVGVKIAVEPHDDFVHSSAVAPVLNRSGSPHVLRVIWDIGNAFAAGEAPTESFELLKDHLAYVQVKDGKGREPDWRLCPLGQGDVPLNQAFELLLENDYQGAFSVEWEYAWHPELDPPETALRAALRTVREVLAASQPEST
ncbi:MAG TPA: sugar phosphate isomerase/epimerase family protein [Anaerolineales bacterium]|nr:sugar phosphate isomerase/epimerase family protein [Anaerolineales bacterium]